MEDTQLKRIIEALIFASDSPLSAGKITRIVEGVSEKRVREVVRELNAEYEAHAFEIVEVAGGFQLVTKADFYPWLKALQVNRRPSRLSRAALETLAIIAYKQPISRVEIDAIRGVNSEAVLGTLLRRNLITIKGRSTSVGRPLLYGTTEEFLRYFGLKSLNDLPTPEELETLLQEREGKQDGRSERVPSTA